MIGTSLLGPGLLRHVGAEPVMFLGAQRALLLQIAHPLVGTAVDDHSGFRAQPVRRLWSTADAMLCMVWGDASQAEAARQRILGIHDRVHGTLLDDVGDRPAGTAYSAHDQQLQAWVWATLVDTTEVVHRRWLGPLEPEARRDLYDGWRWFADQFGIDPARLPDTVEAFAPWYAEQRSELVVGPATRAVGRAVLDPPLRWAPRSVKRAHARVAAGLLDPWLRAAYGVRWGRGDDASMAAYDALIRAFWARVPDARRALPGLYVRGRRLVEVPLSRTGRG